MSKKTELYTIHEQLGAKLIPFAGYDMPVRYQSDKAEHLAVRQSAGMFDVSHMGEFIVRGPRALELIQKISSNDASKLEPGKAQYCCMPNHEGGIVDDMIVYYIRDDQYMIVVNASNIEKDWNWIKESNTMGAEMIDISEETSLIAVSGPKAEAIVQKLTRYDLSQMGTYYCFKETFNGAEKSLIATTGYTGERTFEIFIYNQHAVRMWHDLMEAGQEFGLIPTGLGARDTLRLEMGYMLYGNDINDTTTPLEAGLGWITKLGKGIFNGSAALNRQKAEGLKRKLIGFEMIEKGIPRSHYKISHQRQEIGEVTSGGISPVMNIGIGMAYVPVEVSAIGTEIDVIIRDKAVKAKVVKRPFLEK
ncbi:MAG: glycine cleavage system aminomethyltransferase GcvT [Bacteroidia bacterium]|nr:glycine cleavage system aminomethyltransferase GcvT [Bacteroidia bacterium]